MWRRFEALFAPDARRDGSLLRLIISDYVAYYGPNTAQRVKWSVVGNWREDSPRTLALLFIPRLLHNPCLHATVLIRLASRSPEFTLGMWRTLLIAKHSIDISSKIEIGPGLVLPHPVGIGIGSTVRLGANVTILDYASLGANVALGAWKPGDRLSPSVGDDVVIFTQSIILGGIAVGDRAVIGAGAWVDADVPPRAVHPGRAALFRQLLSR
jgi:serine O-acetyltransferase